MRTICRQGGEGFLKIQTSTFFRVENFGFFEIYFVSVRTRENQCGHFADKGVVFGFSQFCANVIYGRSLIVTLN